MKSLGVLVLPKSSTRTLAVAFDVAPVMVSPTTNLPSVPAPFLKQSYYHQHLMQKIQILTSRSTLSICYCN